MITDDLKYLADKRVKLAALKAEKAALLLAVTESAKYKGLEAAILELSKRYDERDAFIRTEMVNAYLHDPEKNIHPIPGIDIEQKTVVEILDESGLREWCLKNFTPALVMDTKIIKKAAPSGTLPKSLVSVTKEPRATIATDLSAYQTPPDVCEETGKKIIECECDKHRIPF